MKLRFVHSSGKFDVQSAHAYETYRARADMVTHTEAQEEQIILGAFNWGTIRGISGPRSDAAIEYKRSVFELVEQHVSPISDIQYRREGGTMSGKLYAAIGLFNICKSNMQLIQATVHWPRWSQIERRDTYLDGIENLVKILTQYPRAHKRISGDWNRDMRYADNRNHIQALMKPLNLTCDWQHPLPTQGTFGKKLYDAAFISPRFVNLDTFLLPDNNESDHRPYKSELKIPN